MHYVAIMRRLIWRTFPSFSLAILLCVFACVAAATTKKPPPRPVNINTASATELETVPGIGPATAEKILQMRKSYGAFKSVDDLLAIRGIGPKRLDKMRKYLTTGKPAAANAAKSQQSPPSRTAAPKAEKNKPDKSKDEEDADPPSLR
jgi:competence protein ComEA